MTITNGYCTVDELSEWLGDQIPNTASIARAEMAIESASRFIDQYCGRFFYTVAGVRTFAPTNPCQLALYADVVSVGALTVAGDAWDLDRYELLRGPNLFFYDQATRPYRFIEPIPPNYFYRPTSGARDFVTVDGTWGWSAVPTSVAQACKIQSAAIYHRTQSVNGVEGLDSFGVVRTPTRLDPTVAQLLASYRVENALGIA